MFVESIKIIRTTPCLAEKELFKAVSLASANLTELLPYLNAVLERPRYQPELHALTFQKGIVGITILDDQISLTKIANLTEGYEILDWVKDLLNDLYESREEIAPNYAASKQAGLLEIYSFLPKTNCKKCGEAGCMAFAGKLARYEAQIEECPLLRQPEYAGLREKCRQAIG